MAHRMRRSGAPKRGLAAVYIRELSARGLLNPCEWMESLTEGDGLRRKGGLELISEVHQHLRTKQ